MSHFYAVIEPEAAEATIEKLVQRGVNRDDINVVVKQGGAYDTSPEALKHEGSLSDAPEGAISLFGAAFAPLMALSSGALLIAAGPAFALGGAAALAAGECYALLRGFGVPEEKHDAMLDAMEDGAVLLHVDSDKEIDMDEMLAAA